MKVIVHKLSELQYWSFGTKAIDGQLYKKSVYNIYKHNNNTGILYNTRTNALAILKNHEVKFFEEKERFMTDWIYTREMVAEGFLIPQDMNEYKYMLEECRSSIYLRDRWKQFTILPTQKCNARCFYCFENDVKRARMSSATADQVVEFISSNLEQTEEFNLDWFGGEPLMEYDLINKIVTKLNKKTDIRFTSSITTNAILFSEEKIKNAVDLWHLKRASITIDGLEREHNKRKNVLGNINAFETSIHNIRLLLQYGVYVNLRIHIDKYNIEQLNDILIYLSEFCDNSQFHIYVEKLFMPLQVEKHPDVDRYIRTEESEEFYTLMMKLVKKYGFVKCYSAFLCTRRETSCIASRRDTLLIDCDGKLYNCEQEFYERRNNIGNIWEGVSFNDRYFYAITPQIENTECQNCIYLPTCVGGCSFTKSLCGEGHKFCMRGRILTPIAMSLLLEEYSD